MILNTVALAVFDIESYSFFHRFEVVLGKNIRQQTCCLHVLSYSSPLPC